MSKEDDLFIQNSAQIEVTILVPCAPGTKTFLLTPKAYHELSKATHADLANYAFDRFARHVPAFYRLAVWDKVDEMIAEVEAAMDDPDNYAPEN